MLDWNLKSTWDLSYTGRLNTYHVLFPGYWRHFQRFGKFGAPHKALSLTNRLGLTNSSSIAFVGGGFGYIQEALLDILPNISVATSDTSTWVQSASVTTETSDLRDMIIGIGLDPDEPGSDGARILAVMDDGGNKSLSNILDEDITNNGSRNRVRSEAGLGNNIPFNFVISDDVLPTLSDADAVILDSDMRQLGDTVVHIISPAKEDGSDISDPDYNWKHLTDWKTLVGTSGVFAVTNYNIAL